MKRSNKHPEWVIVFSSITALILAIINILTDND